MIKICPSKHNKNEVECKFETWHEPRRVKCISILKPNMTENKATYDQIHFMFYTCVKFHNCKNGWCTMHSGVAYLLFLFCLKKFNSFHILFNPETSISFRGQLIVQLDTLYAKYFKMPLPMYQIEKVANWQVN
jgi:hypothetical protein